MLQRRIIFMGILGILSTFAALSAQGAEKSAKEILDYIDDLYRGESARGVMTMHIVTQHWERTLKMHFSSQGQNKSLVRILEPAKEKGTATLRVENDIWNYLPKTNRTIKLPSSMMSASWMGSHFTNDDLVKESRLTEDYTFEITDRRRQNGTQIIEITCHPKPEAAVVWGRVIQIVRTDGYQPLETHYLNEDLERVRTMIFSNIQQMDDRRIPLTLTVLPENKPNEKTVVNYETVDYNVDLPPATFSLQALKR
ncbi:MAG: outer membrane lipoprotein-sorting protein [Desulfotignum sp.]